MPVSFDSLGGGAKGVVFDPPASGVVFDEPSPYAGEIGRAAQPNPIDAAIASGAGGSLATDTPGVYRPSELGKAALRIGVPLTVAVGTGGLGLIPAMALTGAAGAASEAAAQGLEIAGGERERISLPQVGASGFLNAVPGIPLTRIASPLARSGIRVAEGAALGGAYPLIESGLAGEFPQIGDVGRGALFGAGIGLLPGGMELAQGRTFGGAQTRIAPAELDVVGRTLREPLLPPPTDLSPLELEQMAFAARQAGSERAASASAGERAVANLDKSIDAEKVRRLGERMAGVTDPGLQLQILDQEIKLAGDTLTQAEQRAGLDMKIMLKQQIEQQKALETAARAEQTAVKEQQRAMEQAQAGIAESAAAPEIPKSQQLLTEAAKPPPLANVATEVATQTKQSPYALQGALNQMTAVPAPVVPPVPAAGQIEPVNIGPRDASVSTGTGVPTAAETRILAEQQKLVDEYLTAQTQAASSAGPMAPPAVEAPPSQSASAMARSPSDQVRQGAAQEPLTGPSLASLLRKLDDGDELYTGRDLRDDVDALYERGEMPEALQRAVDDYDAMRESDYEEFGARSGLESEGEEAFIAAVRKAAGKGSKEAKTQKATKPKRATVDVSPILAAKTELEAVTIGGRMMREANERADMAAIQKAMQQYTPPPPRQSTAELRLNNADLGMPPVASLSAKQKLAELQAAGVRTYAGKPIEDANPAQLSNALGKLRRGQLERGAVSVSTLATVGGAGAGGAAGYSAVERKSGESEEEFQSRRLRATVAGAALGAGSGVVLRSVSQALTKKGVSTINTLKSLQDEAIGRERMPDWYIKFRQGPRMTAVREAINNNRARVKDIVANVAKDVNIPNEQNPYLAGKLYPGRSSERVRQAEVAMRTVQDSVVDAAKSSGMVVDDFVKRFDLWLEARHTPYYNASLRDRHEGPGPYPRHRMTDEQAAEVLMETGADGYGKVFDELAKEQNAIVEQTRDLLVKGGIIDQNTADIWRKTYPYYVPFNRILPEDSIEGAVEKFVGGGPGMNVLGTGVYRIKGSDLPVADISGSVYANFIDAIRRTEKNRVDQAALEFFRGPGAGTPGIQVRKPKFGERFDENTMLGVRKQGEKYWIEFNDPKLATAFSNLNSENASGILKLISYPTRWYSGLVTRFSPNFLAANPIRDRQEAALKLASQGDWAGALQQANPAAALYKDPATVVKWIRGSSDPDAQLFQQMLDDGGMAGGFASMTREKAADAVKEFRTSDVNPLVGAKDKFIKFVDFLTDVSEGSTRFRAYKRAIESGATRDEAALAARNISVDFNQKGTVTPQAAALFSFFNPAVQGPVNSTKALIRNPQTLATIAATFVGTGALIDAWNSSFDPDWKKKPTFQFSRTTGIPVIYGIDDKTGEVLTYNIPVAHSLRPVKAVMDFMVDEATGGIDNDNMADELARVGGAVIDSTNPLGSSSFKTAWAPTVARPAVETWINEKFTGSPVVPKWMDADPMIADRAKRYLSSYDTETGKMANNMTDLLAERAGIDVSPERMRYLIRQYSGGPGRVIADFINTSPKIIKAMEGSSDISEIRASEIPVASAFFRRINPEISERESPEYRETEKYVREVKTDEELRRQQARLFYRNEVEKIPAESRAEYLSEMHANGHIPDDPVYIRALEGLFRAGIKGRREADNLIGMLSIESGNRARFYIGKLSDMSPEEGGAYIEDQAAKGLLTPEIIAQMDFLSESAPATPR